MELVFLGNGGGRIILDKQILPTGGFRINSPNLNIHIDPGPGAFVNTFKHKQDPTHLNALFSSHAHIDHCHDANMMIEAMNFGNFNGKKGVFLGSESVVFGFGKFEKQLDEYFKNMLVECKTLKAGEKYLFEPDAKNKSNSNSQKYPPIILKATKTLHEDPTGIGFVLENEGIKIGYTSDTGYFDGIAAQYEGCDFLIINCLRPNNDKLEFHLASKEAIQIVNELVKKPRLLVITHLGMKFLNAGMENQRKLIESETGVKTILAHEGLKLDFSEEKKQQKLI